MSYKFLVALAALGSVLIFESAHAQTAPGLATVVATCGTPPSTYVAGSSRPVLQNTSGQTCGASTTTPSGTQDENLKQVNGATVNVGAGVASTGTQRVSQSSGTYTSSAALAANQIVVASAGSLVSFNVSADSTLSAAAWWVMIYDATTAPVDGAVTPKKCYAAPAGATSLSAGFPSPVSFATGIVIGVSTTGCFTKTASTHAFISGDFQ